MTNQEIKRFFIYINSLNVTNELKKQIAYFGQLHQKLGRSAERIQFLVECRRRKVKPKFILNSIKTNGRVNEKVGRQIERLYKTSLNVEISEAFKLRSFILRCIKRTSCYLKEARRVSKFEN